MVPRRRRHRRRPHHRGRQPVGARRRPHASTPPAWWSRPASSTCSASRSSTCSSTAARPARSPRASPPRSPAKGVSIAPVNDQMLADRKATYDFFKVTQDWRTLAEYFARLERSTSAINVGTFVGSGGLRDYVIGKADRPATADEIDEDEGAGRRGDGSRARSASARRCSTSRTASPSTDELVELAKVAAEHGGIYITHQRSEGNQRVRVARRGVRDRRAGRHPGRDLAPEDRLQGQLGQDARGAPPDRGGARPAACACRRNIYPYNRASNGLDACLPLWVREGGTDADAGAAEGSGDARARQARDGRPERAVREPVVRVGRAGRGDAQLGARPVAAQVRRHELRRDRQGDGQGPARRRHRPGHRRQGRVVGDHLDHARGRRRGGDAHAVGVVRHRLGRAGRGRPAVGVEVASAGVGHVHARARPSTSATRRC